MSTARELLGKITALRQRLEQVQGLAQEAGSAAVSMMHQHGSGLAQLWSLHHKVDNGRVQDREIRETLAFAQRECSGESEAAAIPKQLTARARRALQHGRDLRHALREMQEEPAVLDHDNPIARYYRQTVTITDTTLRMAKLLPEALSGQLQICDGMEVMLAEMDHRLGKLSKMTSRYQAQQRRIGQLAHWLLALADREPIDVKPFSELADALLQEAAECAPLQIYHPQEADEPDVAWVADCVARHSLVVAQVIARIARHDADLKDRATEVVVAAILHDVGMLHVSPKLIASKHELDSEGRRVIEQHTLHGTDIVRRLLPDAGWLVEAARNHHERMKGAGYPDGMSESRISALTRTLAVCDVYAACCAARPHRKAHQTRTALTNTLMMAEQGELDRQSAERLLHLSFYPIGSVVEMADGAVGVVIATPSGWDDLQAPSRPVLAVLTDDSRRCLPMPRYVDLAQCESRSIVTVLSKEEASRVLGERYPEWL